jgi:hypothetical protein
LSAFERHLDGTSGACRFTGVEGCEEEEYKREDVRRGRI